MVDDQARIQPFDGPAGGWGALKSSARHLAKNKGVARSLATLMKVNQAAGFDCPGCAWPEPDRPQTFEFCENGVKHVAAEATPKRVTPAFFAQHSVADLRQQSDQWLEAQGRLTHPMRYNPAGDRYEPVAWADAFSMIGQALRGLSSPNQALFYTSGRTSNEAAFLYQLFVRMFGTNNLPDCSNMCHESSGFALTESIGIGKGTVTLADFEHADAIFVIGQNPGSNHPRMLTTLQHAAQRGCRIVSLNPLREPGLEAFVHPQSVGQMLTGRGTPISSLYLQVLVGGDLAAIKGIMKHLLEADDASPRKPVLDHTFIHEHTSGFEEFARELNGESWDAIETQSGLSREQLKQAADVYLGADAVIACWAMGLTQNKHAVATIQQVVNLLLLRGHLGRRGAGACPVRGHSNVQGDRTMGITELPKPAFLDALAREFDFDPPREHGLDTVGAIEAMINGKARVFIAMGGNFVLATPDTAATAAAMRQCDLTVNVSTKLNRSHLEHGRAALMLPCLGRTEIDVQASGPQKVTVEDSMSMVHASAGRNPPASEHLLSEPAIVAGMAKATLGEHAAKVAWDALVADYTRIRAHIAAVLPELFHDYNQRLEQPGGFYLGNSAGRRQWHTSTGKARFIPAAVPDLTLPTGQLRMMTMRTHDQFNTTIYDNDDRYRGVYGTRQVIFMHADDLAQRGIADGKSVDVQSHSDHDDEPRIARGFRAVSFDVPRGCCAMYFPEANVLVPRQSYAIGSRTPLSKFVPVTVSKAQAIP
ncbi:MAG: FdhF/YdeP family oxidoreductase [Phycisphaeraceae bacterium]